MASNFTGHFQLNQWEAGDQVLREDFNEDNRKTEQAILDARKAPCCVTGTYVGNQGTVTVNVGFRPSFLVVISEDRKKYYSAELQAIIGGAEQILALSRSSSNHQYTQCRITDTGFEITDASEVGMSTTGVTFHYYAFY